MKDTGFEYLRLFFIQCRMTKRIYIQYIIIRSVLYIGIHVGLKHIYL